MPAELSTQQLSTILDNFLAEMRALGDPAKPNQYFFPSIESCDGPGRRITYRYKTYEWMRNPNGVVHGGIIATMLDVSMGCLCRSFTDKFTPTINITINYARPIPVGSDILVTVHAATMGRTSAQLTAELALADKPEQTAVTAMGVYYTARDVRESIKQ